jgi:hypothetical protein
MHAGWQKRIALGLVPLLLCGGLWVFGPGFAARAEEPTATATAAAAETPAAAETARPAEPSDTFVPAPEPTVNPDESPSASPSPAAAETAAPPEPEPTPQGEAAPAEALRVCSLYLQADTAVSPGQSVTLTLQLTADHPDGTALQPFGLLLEPQGLPAWEVSTCEGAHFYQQQKLWVANATVRGGKVYVGEDPLRFTLSVTPFPMGGAAAEASVTLTLLDADGQPVRLTPSDSAPDIVRLALTFHVKQEATAAPAATLAPEATPADAEATAVPEETPSDADATAVPEETPSDADTTAVPEETPADADATVAPEETSADTDATVAPEETSADADTTVAPEETPAPTLTATPEPTPTPAVRRRALHANIDPAHLQVDDVLTLTAELSGYEGLSIGYQWQELQGSEWVNLQGYTEPTVNILITPENLHRAWRYLVTVQP